MACCSVVVTVTNVDEDGSVSLNKPQPQAGRGLEATLNDVDGGQTDEVWQWARSMDMQTWTDIDGGTAQSRSPVAADEGYYLRASVTYADMFGSGKMAYAMTANKVEGRTLSNAAPSFADQDEVDDVTGEDATLGIQLNRSVDENTAVDVNIGKPVSASDSDNDILIYELADTPDLKDEDKARFTINSGSGQIKVGKKLGADTGTPDQREDETSTTLDPVDPALPGGNDDADDAANSQYVLRVKATDPSGASATVNVIVTVVDVNEAPKFGADAPTVLRVEEPLVALLEGTSGDAAVDADTFAATDEDGDDDTVTYEVEGADEKDFVFDTNGLVFVTGRTTDFETKSSYSITIVATSGADERLLRTKLSVTVKVGDTEDAGTVTLSHLEPQAASPVIAMLSDEDGGVTISEWKWAAVDATGETCATDADFSDDDVISGASSAAYTPKAGDVGMCLQARAIYTDNIVTDENDDGVDIGDMAHVVTDKPVQRSEPDNTAPKFPDQDLATQGDQSDSTSREVAENTKAGQPIGAAVSAVDDDDDLMLYTLSGPDAASFGIDREMGQLKTKAALDYETKDTYMVMVVATDPSGAGDSIMVMISVTDENDNAELAGVASVDYAENGTGAVATYTATDQDGHAIVWSLDGDDKGEFMIDDGELAFKSSPDYEKPNSKSTGTLADRNVYNVTVQATGGTLTVAVTVTNVDEDGSVSLNKPQPQVGRGLEATLNDVDGGQTDEVWQWARSMDMQTWTDIDGGTAQSRSPVVADDGYYLRASVTYADMFGSGKMAYAMTANKVEGRTLSNAAPSFADQDEVDDVTGEDATLGIQLNRSVDENTAVDVNIGKPVSASDSDNDILIYELADTPDWKDGENARFTINSGSGQIKVGKKLGADTGQPEDELSTTLDPVDPVLPGGNEDADDAANSQYVLRVKATDPSGASATVNVIVTVVDVNEAPKFGADAPTVLRVEEPLVALVEGTSGDAAVDAQTFVATDEDSDESDPNDVVLSVEGSDEKDFLFDTNGLVFVTGRTTDFETKSSYSITIVATSGADDRLLRTKLSVTVKVGDTEDAGKVTLSHLEPQAASPVIANAERRGRRRHHLGVEVGSG